MITTLAIGGYRSLKDRRCNPGGARFSIALHSGGLWRAMDAAELSDGTLRYLALLAAATARSQVIVVSHAAPLVDAIAKARDVTRIELAKEDGETIVAGRNPLDAPPWKWTSQSRPVKCEQITNVHQADVDPDPIGRSLSSARIREVERAILRAIGVPIP